MFIFTLQYFHKMHQESRKAPRDTLKLIIFTGFYFLTISTLPMECYVYNRKNSNETKEIKITVRCYFKE